MTAAAVGNGYPSREYVDRGDDRVRSDLRRELDLERSEREQTDQGTGAKLDTLTDRVGALATTVAGITGQMRMLVWVMPIIMGIIVAAIDAAFRLVQR